MNQGSVLNVLANVGVLANDTDDDSPSSALRVDVVPTAGPTNGTLTLVADGSFIYTPNPGFNGPTDTFKYQAYDECALGTLPPGHRCSGFLSEATVTITIADASISRPRSVLPVCGDEDSPGSESDPCLTGSSCTAFSQLANVQLYSVPDGATQLTFDIILRTAAFNSEIAIFKVDDANGSIDGMHPGDPGYLATELARAQGQVPGEGQVIFPSVSTAFSPNVQLNVQGGDLIAFLLVQNSSLANLLSSNPQNSLSGNPKAFFSINSLKPRRTGPCRRIPKWRNHRVWFRGPNWRRRQ